MSTFDTFGFDVGSSCPSIASDLDRAYFPTPPGSAPTDSPPLDLSSSAHVSVSSVFYPTANIGGVPADTLLITADGVWFYVHAYRLAAASGNGFGALVPGPAPPGMPLIVPEASGVLNLVLHTAYGLPFAQFVPSFDELEAAVDALARYGAVDALARYGAVHLPAVAPMHDALLAQAPLHPLAVYALAGAHGLDALAVASSAYLLTLALATLSDADSIRMGPVYLRRLFFLHLGRCDALKRLLVTGPVGHSSTPTCNVADQTAITRAWALAAAYLSWEARADVPTSQLSSAFSSLEAGLPCVQCRTALRERVKQLVLQWSLVKATI